MVGAVCLGCKDALSSFGSLPAAHEAARHLDLQCKMHVRKDLWQNQWAGIVGLAECGMMFSWMEARHPNPWLSSSFHNFRFTV